MNKRTRSLYVVAAIASVVLGSYGTANAVEYTSLRDAIDATASVREYTIGAAGNTDIFGENGLTLVTGDLGAMNGGPGATLTISASESRKGLLGDDYANSLGFTVGSGQILNLENIEVTNYNVALTNNGGTLNLNGVNIDFNDEYDLVQSSGTTNLSGITSFGLQGIVGSGTITNSGEAFFDGDNSGFTGTYTQSDGRTLVTRESKAFGGTISIDDGTLIWSTDEARVNGSRLIMADGTELIVGDGGSYTASLSEGANDSVQNAKITINTSAELSLDKTIALAQDVTNNGTLNLNRGGNLNHDISGSGVLNTGNYTYNVLGALGSDINFHGTNSTINFNNNNNVDNIGSNLAVVTGGTNSGLSLNIDASAPTTITTNLNVDNSAIQNLTFNSGTINYNGNLSGVGPVVNKTNTSFGGNNSSYTGTYTQNTANAVTTFAAGSQAFGGDTNITQGTLNWNTTNALGGTLTMDNNANLNVGGTLTVGTGHTVQNSNITVNNGGIFNLNQAVNLGHAVTVNDSGAINFMQGGTINQAINGSGTVGTADKAYTITSALANTIKFVASGSDITLSGNNINQNLGVVTGANANNTGLDLVVSTTNATKNITADIDSSKASTVTFDGGDVNLSGNITGSGNVITNAYRYDITGALDSTVKFDSTSSDIYLSGANVNQNLGVVTSGSANNLDVVITGPATIDKNVTVNGTNVATVTFDSGNISYSGAISGTANGVITNKANTTFSGDNSAYIGGYTQTQGTTTFADGSKAFGGTTTINSGTLNWNTNNDLTSGTLTMSDGTTLNVGGTLTIDGTSSVQKANVKVDGGELNLNNNINLTHNVTMANNGTLNLNKGGTLSVAVNGSGTLATAADSYTITGAIGQNIGFVSNSSTVNLSGNNTQNNFSKVVNGTNNGLDLMLNTGITTSENVNVDGSAIESLAFGNGTFNYTGNVSGSAPGVITNSGNTTFSGTNTFNGTYTQSGGSTTFANGNAVFGGDKNINAGTLTVNAAALDYGKVHLGDNTTFTHTTTSTSATSVDVDNSVVDFKGTGAGAAFNNGIYNLSNVTSAEGKTNTVTFKDASITLAGTDYTGGTNYVLNNTELNLMQPTDTTNPSIQGAIKNYVFDNLTASNASKLSFNVNILGADENGVNKIATDTVTVNNGNAKFNLGNIWITGEENGYRGDYTTDTNVLTGASFNTASTGSILGATTSWVYDVKVSDSTISLGIKDYADNLTLKEMNNTDGTRFFQFSNNDHRDYVINESLGATESGKFDVIGNSYKNVIDGNNQYSFFDISGETELNVTNIVLQNANKTGEGSAINNNSTSGTVNLNNVAVNNAGGNSAVYNKGSLNLENVTFSSSNGFDINQDGGGTVLSGTNSIISGVTGTGTIENKGNSTFAGDNSGYTGSYTQTAGTTTVAAGSDAFGGQISIDKGTLNWYTDNDMTSGATLTMTDDTTRLVVGNGTDDAHLTIADTSTVDGANITINSKGILTFENGFDSLAHNITDNGRLELSTADSTLYKNVTGNGVVYADEDFNLFGSLQNTIKFQSDNVTVNLKSDDNHKYIDNNLGVISASALSQGENNKNLEVIVEAHEPTTITSNVTVDGTRFSHLEFKEGDIDFRGNLTVGGTGADAGIVDNDVNLTMIGNITSSAAGSGIINNKNNLTILGNASGFTGKYNQDSADNVTTVDGSGQFFGGTSSIKDGILNWFTSTDIKDTAKLTMDAGNLNIGKVDENGNVVGTSILTLNANKTIKDDVIVTVNTGSTLNAAGIKDLTLSNEDNWAGKVNVTSGDLTIDNVKSNGILTASGGDVTLKSGTLNLGTGSDVQEGATVSLADGTTTNVSGGGKLALNNPDSWVGDINVNKNGTLTVNNIKSNGKLVATDGVVKVLNGPLTIAADDSIAQAVDVTINEKATVYIKGGDVDLNGKIANENPDSWLGKIEITDGTLDLNNLNGNGVLVARDGGEVNLNAGELIIGKNSIIAGNNADGSSTAVNIAKNTTVRIKDGGEVTFNANDKWEGIINLQKEGTLNIEESAEGILHADDGYLNFSTGKLIIKDGSYIEKETLIDIPGEPKIEPDYPNGSILQIEGGGRVAVDNEDKWNGEIFLNGGTLDYYVNKDKTETGYTGTLTADKGNLNLFEGSILNIQIPSQVQDAVTVDIRNGALVKLKEDAEFRLDSATGDKWNGMINNAGGKLITTELQNDTGNGGGLQQTAGSSTFQDNSHIYITNDGSYIKGGDLNIYNNSSLFLGAATSELTVDNLRMTNNSLLNVMNDKLNLSHIGDMTVSGKNDFAINLAPRSWENDKFIVDNILSGDEKGTVHISDFDFLGRCPIDWHIKYHVFDAKSIKDVDFTTTDKEIFTPIGWYDLKYTGGGTFTSNLTRYNPQVFRGQVSTLAMHNNQLAIDDMLLNHVSLHSERMLGQRTNQYAINDLRFAPYQYTKEDGGLWFKSYVNFENLSMTQGIRAGNNSYGSIIGADLPMVDMKNGWKFLPTAYVGYNGSHQYFSHMGMYQNGAQAGFMGTFLKNDFIGSVMAYGGGYYNEMSVAGYNDQTENWFAGSAAKVAYNLHASKHFTVQPTMFLSYNAFGKQNWSTDFGIMHMNTSMMNGVNVAPGMNFIYARETWNLYATIQYMYNINEQVGGYAGRVALNNLEMKHGYLQYGFGVSKTCKDRLSSFLQILFRNGGRTGVGFQLGLQYLFDFHKPVNVKNNDKSKVVKVNNKVKAVEEQPTKKVIKSL
ncbi:MAG: hypothetical protein NC191_00420 [Muribaculaceae bacterium]|nr:hypothetical protein [Muribaculaceae bacterium]